MNEDQRKAQADYLAKKAAIKQRLAEAKLEIRERFNRRADELTRQLNEEVAPANTARENQLREFKEETEKWLALFKEAAIAYDAKVEEATKAAQKLFDDMMGDLPRKKEEDTKLLKEIMKQYDETKAALVHECAAQTAALKKKMDAYCRTMADEQATELEAATLQHDRELAEARTIYHEAMNGVQSHELAAVSQ